MKKTLPMTQKVFLKKWRWISAFTSGLTVALLATLSVLSASAQELVWEQTKGPYDGTVTSLLATPNGNLYVGTRVGGIFRFEGKTDSWNSINTGLPHSEGFWFTIMGTTIYAGTDNIGVYRSDNWGDTWTPANKGLETDVRALTVLDGTLFAGTNGQGMFRSDDSGSTWVHTGLPNLWVTSFAISGTTLFAGTSRGGVFRSDDKGDTWVNIGLTNLLVTSLAIIDTALFAGTYIDGIFRSDDKGKTWIKTNAGLTNTRVLSLAVMDKRLYAGTDWGGGLFRSEDNGNTWTSSNTGLTNLWIRSLAVMETILYVGTGGGGVFRFVEEDGIWIPVNKGLINKNVSSLAVMGTTLFAGTGGSGVFRASLSETAVAVEQKGKLVTAWGKLKTSLLQNYPNPFNPETWIPFSLAEASEVTIRIYDIKGQLVKALNFGHKERGLYLSKDKAAYWDGRNESGELVASGVYFIELKAKDYQQVRRMVLVK